MRRKGVRKAVFDKIECRLIAVDLDGVLDFSEEAEVSQIVERGNRVKV